MLASHVNLDAFTTRDSGDATTAASDAAQLSALPFDIAATVPSSTFGVGLSMLQRMQTDLKRAASNNTPWAMACLTPHELGTLRAALEGSASAALGQTTGVVLGDAAAGVVHTALRDLEALHAKLRDMVRVDRARVHDLVTAVMRVIEDVEGCSDTSGGQRAERMRCVLWVFAALVWSSNSRVVAGFWLLERQGKCPLRRSSAWQPRWRPRTQRSNCVC